jgi:hypothetical protein
MRSRNRLADRSFEIDRGARSPLKILITGGNGASRHAVRHGLRCQIEPSAGAY